jgi:hypothetical protein
MVEPDQKAMVDAEIQRRKANCADHSAEIKKIQDIEQRMGAATGEATPKQPPSGGGMGRY